MRVQSARWRKGLCTNQPNVESLKAIRKSIGNAILWRGGSGVW
jgi:hypothetical protein